MESDYCDIASQIRDAASLSTKDRFLVIIAGGPGSGKTTMATAVAKLLNTTDNSGDVKDGCAPGRIVDAVTGPYAVVVSMDGFHLPRSVLDQFPDPSQAHARRGAPWTFDVEGIVALVHRLRESADVKASFRGAIPVPTFDHALKDPVPNGSTIPPGVRIIILEGNYLLLDEEIWRKISGLVDLRIFLEVDPVEARRRVSTRHVSAGIETNITDAQRRYDQNDHINGILIGSRMLCPDIVVSSSSENGI